MYSIVNPRLNFCMEEILAYLQTVFYTMSKVYIIIVHPDGYRTALNIRLSEAWSMAQEEIKFAQEKQKLHYDKYSIIESHYKPVDRIMVYMPNAV